MTRVIGVLNQNIMKERITTLILLIAILLSLTNMVWAEGFDFRKTKWGMSESDVKASEPLEIAESEDNLLGYKTKVLDKDVYVGYMFIENQLVRSFYMLAESHSNQSDYINDYQDFKAILEKKYGKPIDDQTIWKNDLYKDDYSHWGTAISMGHLIFQSTWITDTTEIVNVLHGDNYEISCGVQYKSINLKEIEEKAKEKKDLGDF